MSSIYEQIKSAIGPEGVLPPEFRVQTEGVDCRDMRMETGPMAGQTVHYAEGALDGITYYHTAGGGNEVLLEGLKRAVLLAAKEQRFEDAMEALQACFQEGDHMLGCVDSFQDWVIDHKQELDLQVLFCLGCTLLTSSGRIGEVKFALSILELLAPTGEDREPVRTLALSDEFTLFCVFAVRSWENRDEELFAMAQKTWGWGRVHAVRELEPTTQEMKDWLLDEGWKNSVLPAYTALACARKGGLRQRLEGGPLSRDQLNAADGLIQALLDEGPVRNISLLEDAEDLLLAWLDQLERTQPNEEDRKTLQCLQEESGERDWPRVRARLEQLEVQGS